MGADQDIGALADVVIFAGNFDFGGSVSTNGTNLSVSANTALFALLGTNFGGDGRTTFGVPDLQGRAPVQVDNTSFNPWRVGERRGAEFSISLAAPHAHELAPAIADPYCDAP